LFFYSGKSHRHRDFVYLVDLFYSQCEFQHRSTKRERERDEEERRERDHIIIFIFDFVDIDFIDCMIPILFRL
jgi:hypothetical protein